MVGPSFGRYRWQEDQMDHFQRMPELARQWIELARLSQADVAQHLGLSASQVSRLLAGRRNWTLTALNGLMVLCNKTLEDLARELQRITAEPTRETILREALREKLKLLPKETIKKLQDDDKDDSDVFDEELQIALREILPDAD